MGPYSLLGPLVPGPLRLKYDAEADALYIVVRREQPERQRQYSPNVIADLDFFGHIVGIEVLNAVRGHGLDELAHGLHLDTSMTEFIGYVRPLLPWARRELIFD